VDLDRQPSRLTTSTITMPSTRSCDESSDGDVDVDSVLDVVAPMRHRAPLQRGRTLAAYAGGLSAR